MYRRNLMSCNCTNNLTIPEVITCKVKGVFLDPLAKPLAEGSIIAEYTNPNYDKSEFRATYTTDTSGNYNFNLRDGYYNIYVAAKGHTTEFRFCSVHIKKNDLNAVYSLEGLRDK